MEWIMNFYYNLYGMDYECLVFLTGCSFAVSRAGCRPLSDQHLHHLCAAQGGWGNQILCGVCLYIQHREYCAEQSHSRHTQCLPDSFHAERRCEVKKLSRTLRPWNHTPCNKVGRCHWRELPQVWFLLQQTSTDMFVTTKHVFCRNKSMPVATNICLSWQKYFVMTKVLPW